jgi:hypothetical protein
MRSLYATAAANVDEGVILENMSMSDFLRFSKHTLVRFKRIFGRVGLLMNWQYFIFFWRYERFSWLSLILGTFIICTANLNNLLAYIFFIIFFLTLLNNPTWSQLIQAINDFLFK